MDIGANVGIYAMLAASRGARLVCYEPHPASFEKLRLNTAKWNIENHQAAVVGVPRDTVGLFVHVERDTRHTLVEPSARESDYASRDTIDVPAVSIDEVLRTPCELLKIDCEGGEFDILSAAGDTLRNAERLVVEVHANAGPPGLLLQAVRRAGFDVRLHAPYPGMHLSLLTATRQ